MKIEAAQIEMRSRHTLTKTSATRVDFSEVFSRNLAAPRNGIHTKIKSLIAEIIASLQEILADQLFEFKHRCLFEYRGALALKAPGETGIRQILDRLRKLFSSKQIPYEVENESPDEWLIAIFPLQKPAGRRPLTAANFEKREAGRQEIQVESEQLTIFIQGTVIAADHRRIQFHTHWKQIREYTNLKNVENNQPKAIDPLIVNFGHQLAALTPQKFDFDLNSDGETEQIPLMNPGSGFLVLDLDHDQKITNGKELFGPSTGNGFLELSRYDSDRNGWIDASDPVFFELKIWTKDAAGNDQLSDLSEKGVGAICLQNILAPFNHKDQWNQLLGQSRRAGIFLREDGGAGLVQEIEFMV